MDKEALKQSVKSGDVYKVCKAIFGVDVTKGQEDIIHSIVWGKEDQICINAHTRYGKTWAVAKAVLLWVLFNPDHEVDIIAPQYEQASKLREYIADDIVRSTIMTDLVDSSASSSSVDRLRKEVSKRHITFSNGSNIRILSAEGTGDRLMSHGGQLLVCDESCLISWEVYRKKIFRMGEDSEVTSYSKEIHISNPWHRNNHYFQLWEDPEWKNIHIGYEQGIKEGRITKKKIERAREKLTEQEFTVLYESNFPSSVEDALIPVDDIWRAINKDMDIDGDIVWGLDVAEKGKDKTVLTKAVTDGELYNITDIYTIDKDDTMAITSKVRSFVNKNQKLNIDSIGVGAGVHSRLDELGYDVGSIRVGRSPTKDKDRFLNQKSEFYWNLKELFEEGKISVLNHTQLRKELTSIRWELTSGGKIKIIDPESGSPDYGDSTMLCCAKVKSLEGGGIVVDF